MLTRITTAILICLISALVLCSCGGGGGGSTRDDYFVPARIDLDADPNDFLLGQRTLVTTWIYDIDEDGIVLKFRYPRGLVYATDTAYLEADGETIDLTPDTNDSSGSNTFLVFVMPPELFGRDSHGKVKFELRGEKVLTDDESIEASVNIRDITLPDDQQFSIKDPNFGVLDSTHVQVNK
ncbi:MAG: hypothetical protein DCC75_06050 [Proteobacteria bacterium]|nr:MAG: hypothetical protein DCC75_06050 [Pseudomonadota bacterium]